MTSRAETCALPSLPEAAEVPRPPRARSGLAKKPSSEVAVPARDVEGDRVERRLAALDRSPSLHQLDVREDLGRGPGTENDLEQQPAHGNRRRTPLGVRRDPREDFFVPRDRLFEAVFRGPVLEHEQPTQPRRGNTTLKLSVVSRRRCEASSITRSSGSSPNSAEKDLPEARPVRLVDAIERMDRITELRPDQELGEFGGRRGRDVDRDELLRAQQERQERRTAAAVDPELGRSPSRSVPEGPRSAPPCSAVS